MKPRIASEKEVESDEENGLNILELCAMILTVAYRGSRKLTDCPQKKKVELSWLKVQILALASP